MFKTRKGLLLLILLFVLFGGSEKLAQLKDHVFKTSPSLSSSLEEHDIKLSKSREIHILYGDSRGGGHLHGVGKPCKTEFPKEWDKTKVISTVKQIAANDNLSWEQQTNGYFVTQQTVDDVRVRVVLDREMDDIVTAYPLNGTKNPCHINKQNPANDNYKTNE